jgi:hypothetical protein
MLAPPIFDRVSTLIPQRGCADPSAFLLSAEDLPEGWLVSDHPRPETYLQPPLANLRQGESAAGRVYTFSSAEGKVWAAQRVYCTANWLRGVAFYGMPGFAGYVDALAETPGFVQEPLEWSVALKGDDQEVARCRMSPSETGSIFSPLAFDPPSAESSCGVLARYGRYVLVFEIHWTDAGLAEDDVEALVSTVEDKLDDAP